ncbi:hypothetical protein PBAT_24475 [Paenibacillus antarcticus]|uniref:Uncharacterized protein n=1 Tax=Paenibacillus antarcticus TaxID=253703 RepID=A0A162M9E2_9BACL|nr:hypothetical protein PBAT_24475 [Paenibacillus antarcticus]
MTNQLSKVGILFAVNSDTKYYDRHNNTWVKELLPVFKTIFNRHLLISTILNGMNNNFSINLIGW